MEEERHFETNAIRAQHERSAFREHSVPLYLTSSFVFDDAEQARAMFADEISGNCAAANGWYSFGKAIWHRFDGFWDTDWVGCFLLRLCAICDRKRL